MTMHKPYAEEALRLMLGWVPEIPSQFMFIKALSPDEVKKLKLIIDQILKDAPTEPDSPVEQWIPLHEATRRANLILER
jgi:hypothetical protein